MKVRALAIDVDGTMTEKDGTISFDAANATRWLEGRGYKILFVSGRSAQETYSLSAFVGTTPVVVGENGGVIQRGPDHFRIIGNKTNPLLAYDFLSKRIPEVELLPVTPRFTEVILDRTFSVEDAMGIVEESGIPVSLVDSKYSYHLAQKGVNKASGLAIALSSIGIVPDECIAIGDSVTDVPLFEICGYSIALKNAEDDVKAKAKFITKNEMGSGTVEALDHVAEQLLKIGMDTGR